MHSFLRVPLADVLVQHFLFSPQVLCMSGSLDLVCDDEVPILCLHAPSSRDLLPMLWLPHLQAPMMKFPFRALHPFCSGFV
jgi:hypothetical protein